MGLIEASGAPQPSDGPEKAGDPPAERPDFVRTDDAATVCLTFEPGASVPDVILSPAMPPIDPLSATPKRNQQGAVYADRVVVPPGRAAVVESVQTPDTPRGTFLVITDQGVAHPLASQQVLKVLGYDGIRPVRMPAGLVARIPVGSGLSHEAALKQ